MMDDYGEEQLDERDVALMRAIETLLHELLRDSTRMPNKEELARRYARAILVRCRDRIV